MKVLIYILYLLIQTCAALLAPNLLCKVGQSPLYAYDEDVPVSIQIDLISTKCSFLEEKMLEYDQTGTLSISSVPGEDDCFVENNEAFSLEEIYEGLRLIYEISFCSQDLRSEAESPFDRLNGYGCYCKLEDPNFRGYGQPINSFDEACFEVQQGYLCAASTPSSITDNNQNPSEESESSDFRCTQAFTGYFVVTNGGSGISESCELFNNFLADENDWNLEETNCAINKCKIDSALIIFMLASALGQSEPFDHSGVWIEQGGTFDREVTCGRRLHPDQLPRMDECCGFYPRRRMLKRSEECCRGNYMEMPYHRRTEHCCEVDGQTIVTGSGQCEGEIV